MQKLNILNTREVKDILKKLKDQFGFEKKLDYVFLQNRKGKIYLMSKDLANLELDLSNLRIDTLGLYFAKKEPSGLRLSIEGSQLIGPEAKKNILELDEEQRDLWVKGYDMDLPGDQGFVIVKYKQDFMGCGKLKNDNLYNYVSKSRRLVVINA